MVSVISSLFPLNSTANFELSAILVAYSAKLMHDIDNQEVSAKIRLYLLFSQDFAWKNSHHHVSILLLHYSPSISFMDIEIQNIPFIHIFCHASNSVFELILRILSFVYSL